MISVTPVLTSSLVRMTIISGLKVAFHSAYSRMVGQDVRRQLDYFKAKGFRQGQVVITTGGDWNRRAVIHAVVYDIEDYRFPTAELVRTLTRRILESAVALGARSIALPILGSGHARGHCQILRPRACDRIRDPCVHERARLCSETSGTLHAKPGRRYRSAGRDHRNQAIGRDGEYLLTEKPTSIVFSSYHASFAKRLSR